MNLKLTDVYISIPIETLPDISWRGYVYTKRDDGSTYRKLATFFGPNDDLPEGWLIDDSYEDEKVTHWFDLRRDAVALLPLELKILLEDYKNKLFRCADPLKAQIIEQFLKEAGLK